ncbi:AzlC family ABC transporter permease [Vibrio mexicanus]|uniref:AzlC family ABC transporter permease n=1 Tax=Vibrio mexicanus TaxID=1004326 RepID=UPI00063C74CB|nr:AzlC family ABC transporter permease [Vibrio mexicanus]
MKNRLQPDITIPISSSPSSSTLIARATLDVLPLCIAVAPWGVLCGSIAIQVGLTSLQAQLMSLLVFAGAAQLSSLSLVGAASGYLPILSSTFVISSRHLLYSAVFQNRIRTLPWYKRVGFAFFLTDEMFALTESYMDRYKRFSYLYALSTGVVFYLMWNLSTFAGVMLGSYIEGLEHIGLEFAIAATFIAIVIPLIKNLSLLISVVASGLTMLLLEMVDFEMSLIVATVTGMAAGYLIQSWEKK